MSSKSKRGNRQQHASSKQTSAPTTDAKSPQAGEQQEEPLRPTGLFAHVGEPRVDKEYWSTPLPLRIYLRLLYSIGGMFITGCAAGYLGLPDAFQWGLGTGTFLVVLTFRWLRPNGFGDLMGMLMETDAEARAELERGDYTGVPKFLQNTYIAEQQAKQDKAQEQMERNAAIKAEAKANMKGHLAPKGKRR